MRIDFWKNAKFFPLSDSSSVLRKALDFTTNEEISCSTSHIQPPPTDDVTSLHATSSVTASTNATTRCRLFLKIPSKLLWLHNGKLGRVPKT